MVEDDVFDVQAPRELAGVFDGRMILFVRVENGFIGVEAEGFVKEPLAAFDVVFFPKAGTVRRRKRSDGRRTVP